MTPFSSARFHCKEWFLNVPEIQTSNRGEQFGHREDIESQCFQVKPEESPFLPDVRSGKTIQFLATSMIWAK